MQSKNMTWLHSYTKKKYFYMSVQTSPVHIHMDVVTMDGKIKILSAKKYVTNLLVNIYKPEKHAYFCNNRSNSET